MLQSTNGIENISDIVKNIHSQLNHRITIIDENGIVIAEIDKNLEI